jgi:hypothetical protein
VEEEICERERGAVRQHKTVAKVAETQAYSKPCLLCLRDSVRHLHCNGNSVYIFLFWELRNLSPNFHIHVSVSDLYIPRIGTHTSSSINGSSILGIYNLLTDT